MQFYWCDGFMKRFFGTEIVNPGFIYKLLLFQDLECLWILSLLSDDYFGDAISGLFCFFIGFMGVLIHLQILSSWKRKVSHSMAFCYKSEESRGSNDWRALSKHGICKIYHYQLWTFLHFHYLNYQTNQHVRNATVNFCLKINDFYFSFMQSYSGNDLHGVTAKVVDMPHHCTWYWSS